MVKIHLLFHLQVISLCICGLLAIITQFVRPMIDFEGYKSTSNAISIIHNSIPYNNRDLS